MTPLMEPTPSATYYKNVEYDPPKPKPWNLKPRKRKKRNKSRRNGDGK